jgi:membrane associated rhomboid family serine protease
MNSFPEKLKQIFVPFLIIAICIIGVYTLLNWLLFIKLQVFSLKEDIIKIWIPMALPWIPIWIRLQPRIKLLNLKQKKGNLRSLYIIMAGIAIVIPTLIAQSYLDTASGKLSQLDNINMIEKQAATKYYTLKKFHIDKSHISVQSTFEITGKNSQYFGMNLFVVMPIFLSAKDTLNENCLAWYGLKYHDQISNDITRQEKEDRFQHFANASQRDFESKNLSSFIYLERLGYSDDYEQYVTAIKKNKTFSTNSTTFLVGINEPFEARNGNKLGWIFGAFAIGGAVWLIMILIPRFDKAAPGQFQTVPTEDSMNAKEALGLFIPRDGYFITPIVIDLNILVFIVMVVSGLGFLSFKPGDLLAWGGNFRPSTTNGEWWRLLTSIFLHGGLMHLLANMCGLLFAGIFLEPKLGKTRYSIVYLVTGLLASVTSLWWHDNTVSVGASGAIFGLYGVFLAFLATKVFPKEFSKALLTSMLVFVGYNLLMGLRGGIDNAAHLGGLVSGFVIGLILSPGLKRDQQYAAFVEEAQSETLENSTLDKS